MHTGRRVEEVARWYDTESPFLRRIFEKLVKVLKASTP
jgi:hypothetical protein